MIDLRKIAEIKETDFFFIPDYQRGYKWTQQHVEALLTDIFEFANSTSKNLNKTYCLQPVVLKRMKISDMRLVKINQVTPDIDYYELIDGQQRLTTIYLILLFLNERYKEEFITRKFQLYYETRERSREFLLKMNKEQAQENIDFHHIWQAYKTIENYFSNKKQDINLFESTLLFRTQVIWYEVEEDVTAEDVFKRLNSGKIQLDNSELIKALFLGNHHHENNLSNQSRYQIAIEWEAMESKLLDDQFWFFLDNSEIATNRISYIFSIIANQIYKEDSFQLDAKDERFDFIVFNQFFNENSNIGQNWERVKKLYLTLLNWFEDREIFHFAGYLMTEDLGYSVSDILLIFNGDDVLTTDDFKLALLEEISDSLSPINIGALQYGSDNRKITMILLWNNISYILKNKSQNYRFQFDQFKGLNFDIEHIKSMSSDIFKSEKTQNDWLKDFFFFITKTKIDDVKSTTDIIAKKEVHGLIVDIYNYLKNNATKKEFRLIYTDILNYYGIVDLDTKIENGIRNLCLLDQKTNRGYKNAIFPIKRHVIIASDVNGVYILPTTKNAFLKQYSSDIRNMIQWNENDMDDYAEHIADEIKFIDKLMEEYGK